MPKEMCQLAQDKKLIDGNKIKSIGTKVKKGNKVIKYSGSRYQIYL